VKRWQWGAILAAVAVSAVVISFASIDHVQVEPPSPGAVEAAAPAAPPSPPPVPSPAGRDIRAPSTLPDEPVAPKLVPGPGVGKVVVAGSAPPSSVPVERPAVTDTPEPSRQQYPLDRDGIRAAVHDAMPELRQCYESWLMAEPSLAGTLKVKMVLKGIPDGGSGSYMDEIVVMEDAGMGHMALEGCVRSVLSTMRFDAPEGGGTTTIHYPFTFNSGPARER
jgi:hypothetical protein